MARSDIDWATRPGSNLIDLGEQGLSQGGDLTGYVSDYLGSGNQVYIPPGEYDGDFSVLAGSYGNASLVGDPAGVTVHRPDPGVSVEPQIDSDGPLLFENVTERGLKGTVQSDIRPEPNGGDITFRNWNYPDGTVDGSDSQGWFSQEGHGGTVRFENCYVGPHGNSCFYFDDGGAEVIIDGCTVENSNTAFRPSPAGMTVRNTICIADGHVPEFDQGNGPAGALARFFRIKEVPSTTVNIENLHWTQTAQCEHPGRLFDVRSPTTFNANGLYMYNEISDPLSVVYEEVDADWNMSNAHISGSGHTDVPFGISGSEMPDSTRTVWKPVGGGSSPGGGGDGSVERITVDGETELAASSATSNFGTQVRTVHSGYTGNGFLDLEPPDGSYAEWALNVSGGGTYDVTFRYSNGDASPRTGTLTAGQNATEVTFEPTGSWNTWQTTTVGLNVPSGETTLRLEPNGDDVGQIDYVTLAPQGSPGGEQPVQGGSGLGGLALLGLGAAAVREYTENR